MLFSEFYRSDTDRKRYSESDFEFLDRSAREDSACIRETLNNWFLRYPEQEKKDLLARFKSRDNYQHYSAAFELYLHELLKINGFVVELHPETPGEKGTHPDFLVIDPNGFEFYVEAVQSSDIKRPERSGNSILNVVFDSLNNIVSHDYFLDISYNNLPPTSFSGKKLRIQLQKWLDNLNYEEVYQQLDGDKFESLPKYNFTHEGWTVEFTAIPRSPENRDRPLENVIGSFTPGGKWLSTWESIRDSLVTKGKHYGDLGRPLLIVVNANVYHLEKIDIMEALFGKETFVFESSDIETVPRMERAPNGLWFGPKGIRYKRISGVLIGFDVKPWTFGVRDLTLYLNPWAYHPINGLICTLPVAKAYEGKMRWNEGSHPKDILKLPSCYPGIT